MVLHDYYSYIDSGLISPILFAVLLSVVAVTSVILFLKKKAFLKASKGKGFLYFLFHLVAACITLILIFPTIEHGLKLAGENEAEAQMIVGTITSIEDVKRSPRYSSEEDSAMYAVLVTVDTLEEPLYVMSRRNLKTGDTLYWKYLPKSQTVLGYGSEGALEALMAVQSTPRNILSVLKDNAFIILFSIAFLILFYLKQSGAFETRLAEDLNKAEPINGHTVTYRTLHRKKIVLIAIGIILFGIWQATMGDRWAMLVPTLLVGAVILFRIFVIERRPVLIYTDREVVVYTLCGKKLRHEYSEIRVQSGYTYRGNVAIKKVSIGFESKWFGKNFSDKITLNAEFHAGIDEFLAFLKENGLVDLQS